MTCKRPHIGYMAGKHRAYIGRWNKKRIAVVKVSLPTLDQESVVFEQFTRQGLGKVIGLLVVGIDLVHFEFVLMGPKPMPLVEKVAGAIGDAIVGRKIIGTLVVLKCTGAHGGPDGRRKIEAVDGFKEETLDWEQGLERIR